jgi:hypothetical protein
MALCVAAVALLFPSAALAVYSDPVLFPLLEASGSASGNLIAVGRFCGRRPGSEPWLAPTAAALASPEGAGGLAVVVNTSSGDVHLMAGPTPHVIHHTLQAQPFARGATVLAAGDLDGDGGDELLFAGPQGVSVVQFGYTAGECTAGVVKKLAADPSITDIIALTTVPLKKLAAGSRAQLLGVTKNSAKPFVILSYSPGPTGFLLASNRTDLGITLRSGWTWNGVSSGCVTRPPAAQAGATFAEADDCIVAVTRVSRAQVKVSRPSVEVLLLGGDGLAPTGANATVALALDGGGLVATLVADVFGDGAPGVLLVERNTRLHYLWPGAPGQVMGLGHELLALPGGAVQMDAGREWVAAATGPWLAGEHVLEREVQLFGLRAPDNLHDFSVSIVRLRNHQCVRADLLVPPSKKP